MKRSMTTLLACALLGCPVEETAPCDDGRAAADEVGEVGGTGETDETGEEVCENAPEPEVAGGYVYCEGGVDPTLEQLTDYQAVTYEVIDYHPGTNASYSAIVDGREPLKGVGDWRGLVPAVVSYDCEGAECLAMLGRVCCPGPLWFDDFPESWGTVPSATCRSPFYGPRADEVYEHAYCLPMPDVRWPATGQGSSTEGVEPVGGLCVFGCNTNEDCPGYPTGQEFCSAIDLDGDPSTVEAMPDGSLGACRSAAYPLVPTPLAEPSPLLIDLTLVSG